MFSKIPSGVKLFALVWLVVALVPPLNEAFRAVRVTQSPLPWISPPFSLEKRDRDDARVLALEAQGRFFGSSASDDEDATPANTGSKRSLREFDALAARFPDQLWLRAQELWLGTTQVLDINEGHGFARKTLDPQTQSELQMAVRAAKNARKREPDNSFWGGAEAIYRFALRDDAGALFALEAAGRARRFDDYQAQQMRNRLAVMRLRSEPLWEEKLANFYQSGGFTGGEAKARNAIKNRVSEAQKRGDAALALRWLAADLRGEIARRSDLNFAYGAFFASSRARRTVLDVARALDPRVPAIGSLSYEEQQPLYERAARIVCDFARKHNRADLVPVVLDAVKEPETLVQQFVRLDSDMSDLTSFRSGLSLRGLWFLIALALGAWAFALVWLVGMPLRKNESPTRGNVTVASNAAFWALLSALLLAWQAGIGGSVVQSGDEIPYVFATTLAPLVVALGWLLPVALVARARNWRRLPREARQKKPMPRRFPLWRRISWALCALGAVFTVSNGRGLWDETPFGVSIMAPLFAVALLVALGLEAWRAWNNRRPRAKVERIERTRRERVSFFLNLARSSAGILAIVWSFVFLFGALGLWPLRAQLNRAFEHRLQIGERAWMQEQVGARPK